MTCRACEVRVSKSLRGIAGVRKASASASRATATVVSDKPLTSEQIRRAVEKAGYKVGGGDRRWLSRDPAVWKSFAISVAVVAGLGVLLTVSGLGGFVGRMTSGIGGQGLGFVALLGVAASVSTCMALVGGVVLSLSASYAEANPGASRARLVVPQLVFNAGRVVGFGVLGCALGALGSLITLQGVGLAVAMVAVALVMGLLGIRLTGISPRLSGKTFALPGFAAGWLGDSSGGPYRPWAALGLGAASFFLPCGFTQAVQVYALSTGSPLRAGLVMAVFALGTAPGLLGVGSITALFREQAEKVTRVMGVVVLAFALVNLAGGARSLMLGVSDLFASPPPALPSGAVPTPVAADGKQHVTTEITYDGYSPQNTLIYAGVPVVWTLQPLEVSCANSLRAPELGITSSFVIPPGENKTVEFTVDGPGTYRYTCAMGMYEGYFTAVSQ
jgi:sulfite exporter TauE/SafE/copper chaperone CopZ/plastocyanin